MEEKLSEQIRRAYMVHVDCDRPFTKKQVLEWMVRVQAMEREIAELRPPDRGFTVSHVIGGATPELAERMAGVKRDKTDSNT